MELKHTPSWGLCILLVLLKTMHSCSSSSARSLGNETDRWALLDIKIKMKDPNGFLNSWNDSQHHCLWLGVRCGARHGRVTNLTLQGKSLSGTISPHIGNLSFMKGIRLGENSLHGEIPQQIVQLSRMKAFNVSANLLSGEIPVNFSRCSKLLYLDMMKNYLTGKVPTEIGSLTKLNFLYLFQNNLTGKIPTSLGNLSSLIVLDLRDNNMEGSIPNELGSFSRLEFLGLGPNKLRGQIPPSLFNMSSLGEFAALGNFLSGNLPTNFGLNLPNLQQLAIGGNNFTGVIPNSISNCTNLQYLDLQANNFDGKVPPSLSQLVNLERLSLDLNSLHGNVQDFLVPLTNCTNLILLSFGYNNFSGVLPNTIGNLSSHLTEIYMATNKISGTIPMELGNLLGLWEIAFAENSFNGAIPSNLAKLQNLRVLDLSANRLSGEIPPTLCRNMSDLSDLWLMDNNLGGDLGRSFAECKSLNILDIHGNNLGGSIPSNIFGSYISPFQLYLSNNSLNGTLPPEIGKLANLQRLDVSHNKLSGYIPSTIGDFHVIETLDLHSNIFSGPLPLSLAFLKGIQRLDLSVNNLTGPIPDGLKHLVYLTYLNLSYNDLEGEVPTDGVFTNASQIMLQGNTKLCGGIFELRLQACPIVPQKTRGKKHFQIIIIPIFSTLLLAIILVLYRFLCKTSDRVRTGMPPLRPTKEMLRVSYHDLYRATSQFSPRTLIGSGSFGNVYKGSLVLENGEVKVLAVKVLDLQNKRASKSFKAECKALSNLRHRNLVPLITYCSSIDHKGSEFKALVYKYIENGNLDTWLHPNPLEPEKCLNLLQRLNIAIDVASVLDHLHNHSHMRIAHCDVKPSNILLDNDLTAYVGDFGLARLLPQIQQGASSSTIAIRGTIGYAPPEYVMGLEVSTQGDVYSYGIMLLEMLTGKRPTNDAFIDGLDLHNYVKTGISDQVWEIVDPSLISEEARVETRLKEQDCIISALKLGIGCSQGAATDRVDMKQVIRELHLIKDSFMLASQTNS